MCSQSCYYYWIVQIRKIVIFKFLGKKTSRQFEVGEYSFWVKFCRVKVLWTNVAYCYNCLMLQWKL